MKSTTALHRRHPPRPHQQQTPPTRQISRWGRLLRVTLSPTPPCTTRRKLRSPLPHHVGQLTNWLIELAPLALPPPQYLQTNTIARDRTACSAAPTSVSAPTTPLRSALDTIQIQTSPAPRPPRQLPNFSPQFFLLQRISTPPMSPMCNSIFHLLASSYNIHPVGLQ